jgi:hypothetical protein
MSKSRDTKKDTKKKPAQTVKEKRKSNRSLFLKLPQHASRGANASIHFQDLLNPSDLPVGQPHLDPVGMMGGRSKDVLNRSAGKTSAALIRLTYHVDSCAGVDVFSVSTVHLSENRLFICLSWCYRDGGPRLMPLPAIQIFQQVGHGFGGIPLRHDATDFHRLLELVLIQQ